MQLLLSPLIFAMRSGDIDIIVPPAFLIIPNDFREVSEMTQDESITATDESSKIIHAYVDAFNRGDIDALKQIFTEDAQVHGVLGWGGLDEVAPIWRQLHDALNMTLQVDDILVQGDQIVARFTERGTSQEPFLGQGPTGKSSEVVAIEWFIIRDQRIYKRWGVRDSASHFRQMGLSLG